MMIMMISEHIVDVIITIIVIDDNDDIENHIANNFLEYVFSSFINLADTGILPAPLENICEYDFTFFTSSFLYYRIPQRVCMSDCVGRSWFCGSLVFQFDFVNMLKTTHRCSQIFSNQCQGHALVSVKRNVLPAHS